MGVVDKEIAIAIQEQFQIQRFRDDKSKNYNNRKAKIERIIPSILAYNY